MRIEKLVSGKTSYALIAGLGMAFFISAAALVLPPGSDGGDSWRSWDVVLLDGDASLKTAMEALKKAGVSPVWSELNQTVCLTDFVTTSRVPLSEALGRLLPDDPRRTPWLDRLLEYFRVEDGNRKWSVLYIPTRLYEKAKKTLGKLYGAEPWLYVDKKPSNRIGLLWIPSACLVAFLAFKSRSVNLFALLGALPWIPLWLSGNPHAALAGILGYLALLTSGQVDGMEPGRVLNRLTWDTAAHAAPVWASFLAVSLFAPGILPSSLLSLVSACALLIWFEDHYLHVEERRVHAVFKGRTLDSRRAGDAREKSRRRRSLAAFGAAAAMLTLYGACPAASRSAGSPEGAPALPLPVKKTDPMTGGAARICALVRERSEAELPDLADAVAHRAYQQAIPFSRIGSRQYGLLDPVLVERYSQNGTAVRETQETVLKFDEAWVRETLREEGREGIGAVLGDQGGIVRVEKQAAQDSRPLGSLALKDVFFYIMLLAPAGLGLLRGKREWTLPVLKRPARSEIIP